MLCSIDKLYLLCASLDGHWHWHRVQHCLPCVLVPNWVKSGPLRRRASLGVGFLSRIAVLESWLRRVVVMIEECSLVVG